MTPLAAFALALADRDPETLIGPLFFLYTRLVSAGSTAVPQDMLADHLAALAAHPAVDPALRFTAGALAIEHRDGGERVVQ